MALSYTIGVLYFIMWYRISMGQSKKGLLAILVSMLIGFLMGVTT